ncbi:MAG TPA: type II toxin-antitoxin system HicA family toxin [bacterium]
MPKFPVLKPKEIIKVLEKLGFVKVRSRGSHLQYKKGNLLVTVPFHNKDLRQETLKSILRQAQLSIEDLNDML